MARFGISIVKGVSFRGSVQEFANVYHYSGPDLTPERATNLAQAIKAIEVPLHSTDVQFLRYSVWSTGLGQANNQMIAQGNLSGTGSQGVNTNMDRERAFLIQWPAGLDSRGRQVYLRKWYHACGNAAGVGLINTQLQQTSPLTQANKDLLTAQANNLNTITVDTFQYQLVAQSGRVLSGNARSHNWLEHHQLGDMWR